MTLSFFWLNKIFSKKYACLGEFVITTSIYQTIRNFERFLLFLYFRQLVEILENFLLEGEKYAAA